MKRILDEILDFIEMGGTCEGASWLDREFIWREKKRKDNNDWYEEQRDSAL